MQAMSRNDCMNAWAYEWMNEWLIGCRQVYILNY